MITLDADGNIYSNNYHIGIWWKYHDKTTTMVHPLPSFKANNENEIIKKLSSIEYRKFINEAETITKNQINGATIYGGI